jgi:hypothetical protein
LATVSAGTLLDETLQDLIHVFNISGFDEGFDHLMGNDSMSLRECLMRKGYST